jgi:hypothetical protein
MNTSQSTRSGEEAVWAALFSALAITLPVFLHPFGISRKFLLMFPPVLCSAFLLRPRFFLFISVASPLLSSLITGMPPLMPPIAFVIMCEFAIMSLLIYVLYQKLGKGLAAALIAATLADRLFLFFVYFFAGRFFGIPAKTAAVLFSLETLPGVAVYFLAVPALVRWIKRRSFFLQSNESGPSLTH